MDVEDVSSRDNVLKKAKTHTTAPANGGKKIPVMREGLLSTRNPDHPESNIPN